ncbi:MAG: nucleotidyltransferase substrate binding protein, partial [Burkholderiales bacterium]
MCGIAHIRPVPIDFSALERATARLEEGLARHLGDPVDEQLRDGLIQRFEFTYDLAPKTLRRALEESADSPDEIDMMSFPTLIRTGWEKGLLKGGWPDWHGFRETRNTTSHIYDEAKAIAAVSKIPAFLNAVQHLVRQL